MPPAAIVLLVPASVKSFDAMNGMSSAARPQACAFLDLGGGNRPGERAAQLFGRLQRNLDGDPRARSERGVHEIDIDGIFVQSVMRVVIRHDRMGHIEPPVTALAGAVSADDLNDRGAHLAVYLAKCFPKKANTFCQPSSACSIRYIGRS